MVHKLVNITKL